MYARKRALMLVIGFGVLFIFSLVGGIALALHASTVSAVLDIVVPIVLAFGVLLWFILHHSQSGILLMGKLRGLAVSRQIANTPRSLFVADGFRMANAKCIEMGDHCQIGKAVDLLPVKLYGTTTFQPRLEIGENVCIGDYNRLACCDRIRIEDDVLFAAYVHITDHSHNFEKLDIPVIDQGISSKGPVRIGRGTWIGIKAEILPGVTIGQHCVVAAGAVVTKSVPDFSLVAGCPAKVVKQYDHRSQQWVAI